MTFPRAASCGLPVARRRRPAVPTAERGASLIVSLLMLVAVLLLGISAARIALMGEKASRNDRDRQIAFQAAEAALLDAEMDIQNSPDPAKSRSHAFSKDSTFGFPGDGEEACRTGETNIYLGLCKRSLQDATPVWLTVDFLDGNPGTASSVPYGRFTGQTFQTGSGSLPGRPPRYIIELMLDSKQGGNAEKVSYFYRVTAIGFGARDATQVLLQTFYRKED
jgi:type IV pilus assembly protein PilX